MNTINYVHSSSLWLLDRPSSFCFAFLIGSIPCDRRLASLSTRKRAGEKVKRPSGRTNSYKWLVNTSVYVVYAAHRKHKTARITSLLVESIDNGKPFIARHFFKWVIILPDEMREVFFSLIVYAHTCNSQDDLVPKLYNIRAVKGKGKRCIQVELISGGRAEARSR